MAVAVWRPIPELVAAGRRSSIAAWKSAGQWRVAASGFWPFGLSIEARPEGVLIRPARRPRDGWEFGDASGNAPDAGLSALRNLPNAFDEDE